MSGILNLSADITKEKFHALKTEREREQSSDKRQLAKQEASTTTGVQWAVAQPQSAQASAQVNNGPKSGGQQKAGDPGRNFELVHPSIEDAAVLSTAVSMNDTEVEAPRNTVITRFLADRLNMGALEQSYRDCFRKSKSHNLLLERFMANVKFSVIEMLVSMLGVSAGEQTRMQAEVKKQALSEIDSKLKNDWAYTKAMLEITSG